MKILKFILPLAIVFALLLPALAPAALALEEPEVGANAVVLLEMETGDKIFSKNQNIRAYPASLTKIMTVLLAVEACESGQVTLYDEVTASENMGYDLIPDGSSAGIVPGETMTLESLMYCAMVASANEACNVIAEYIGGTIPNFIDMMNSRARELGCTSTNFSNAHGIHDENHYTTANDLCLISQAAVTHTLFMDMCSAASVEIPATNVSKARKLSNTNGLINSDSYYTGYYYEYARGVKTGHTSDAGYCLISTASKDNIRLLCVVMGGLATDKGGGGLDYGNFSDSILLYDWAFSNFSYRDILTSNELITEIPLTMGSEADSVGLRPERSINYLLPNDIDAGGLQREITIYSERDGIELQAPVESGSILGEIKILRNGRVIGSTNLVAATSVSLSKSYYIKSEIAKVTGNIYVKLIFWALVLLFCGYLVLVIRYRVLRRRHLKSVKAAKLARERARAKAGTAAQSGGGQPPINFFSRESISEPHGEDSLPPDDNTESCSDLEEAPPKAADRDYFEEFFRR